MFEDGRHPSERNKKQKDVLMSGAVTRTTAAAVSSVRALAVFAWFMFHLWKGSLSRQEEEIGSRDGVLGGLLQARGSMSRLILHAE